MRKKRTKNNDDLYKVFGNAYRSWLENKKIEKGSIVTATAEYRMHLDNIEQVIKHDKWLEL